MRAALALCAVLALGLGVPRWAHAEAAAAPAAAAPAADADVVPDDPDAPDAPPFGAATLREILDAVRARHLAPLLEQPRPWVAGANGALSLLHPPLMLMEAGQRRATAAGWPGFSGSGEPLRCGGPPRTDVLLVPRASTNWSPPWRDQLPPLAWGVTTARALDVEVAAGFAAPFDEAAFRCIVSRVLEATPAEQHEDVWRRAVRWLLRAHDVHTRHAEERLWEAVNRAESSHAELGFSLRWHEQRWQISSVVARGPADEAGIRGGDWLLAVAGKTTVGMKQQTLAGLLDRKPGSRIAMRVQTGDESPRNTTLVVRELLELDVTAAPLAGVRDALVVAIRKFAPGGDARLATALHPKKGRPPKLLVLDLRGNGGGIIPVALAILGQLAGPVAAAQVTTRDGSATVDADAAPAGGPLQAPLAVLVDAGCASACELLTSALRRHRGAVVFGRPTYGKATLQDAIPLKQGPGRLMLTIGRFDQSDGGPIQAVGLLPDVIAAIGRNKGPREGDLDFALRVPGAPYAPAAPAKRPALQRCLERLPAPAVGDSTAKAAPAGTTPAQRAAKHPLVAWMARVVGCVAGRG